MKACIILGCHGRKLYGLTMCDGTSNIILDLQKVPDDKEDIYSYLDNHCKLFDRIATDQNKINNVINFLSQSGYLTKHMKDALYDYIAMHRRCGLFMYVEPIPD
jgi:hypothetical protein